MTESIEDAVAHETFGRGPAGQIETVLYQDGHLTVCHGVLGGCIDLNENSVGNLLDGTEVPMEQREEIWSWLQEVLE